MPTFAERLLASCEANRSLLCVGLDPDPALMPIEDVTTFNRGIIDATKDLVCAYKPNLAFYEALGKRGIEALGDTVGYIRETAPGMVVVGDAKRGDISSTNTQYAKALFDVWGFDAATVNGYAGGEALAPFFEYMDRGVFVWCRSSNPAATELQDLQVAADGKPMPLYKWVAVRASEWNTRGNVGLVVGATYPDELGAVRALCPDMPILTPGVGSQGGVLSDSVKAGIDNSGRNLLVSSSRGVLYASFDPAQFPRAAREAARTLRDRINGILAEEGRGW